MRATSFLTTTVCRVLLQTSRLNGNMLVILILCLLYFLHKDTAESPDDVCDLQNFSAVEQIEV